MGHHFFRIPFTYKTGGDTNHIGIVMGSCQLGQFFTPANGGPDALVFIGSNRHAIGTAA